VSARHHQQYEERYDHGEEQPKEEEKMEMDGYICEVEDISDKEERSIGSTNNQPCSGSNISIA